MPDHPYSQEELLVKFRNIGKKRYHHRHPFPVLMHEGKLTRKQLQAWALNRYYYQSKIPAKDSIIMSRCEDLEFRRKWRQRILDHDGNDHGNEGGIRKWIHLAQATGLSENLVVSSEGVLPLVRYVVDSYLNLVSKKTFLEAVASSMTELFSTSLISFRIEKLSKFYPEMRNALRPNKEVMAINCRSLGNDGFRS